MPDDPDALMIFAAGFGTRMGRLTAARPKPLIPLAGETLLDRALGTAREAGITRIVVNAHYLADQIETALSGSGAEISREAPEILDTGGGLLNALPLLGEGPVFTLNPDALFIGPNPLSILKNAWGMTDASALLLLVPPDRAEMRLGGGDFSAGDDGRLSRGGPMIYTGAQIVDPAGLETLRQTKFSLNAYWDRLAAAGRLRGIVYPGKWCDVGSPEALVHAETLLAGAGT